MTTHVMVPDGQWSACGDPRASVDGVTRMRQRHAIGTLSDFTCGRCRRVLYERPQLLNAIVQAMRARGEPVPDVASLDLGPRRHVNRPGRCCAPMPPLPPDWRGLPF
jgi:hypothetical protein